MSLASIYQNPHTPAELSIWSFSHQAHHRDITRVIFELAGIRLDEYVLDPFDPGDEENWLATHQKMHDQMNEILGISGFPLSAVDWSDQVQLASWLNKHGNEHFAASQILNIG